MDTVRFLVVSHFYEAHGGGIERVAAQMCRHMAALGYDVDWAAGMAHDAPQDQGVGAVPLPCFDPIEALTGLPLPIPGPRAIVRLWKAVGTSDVVAVHDALYFTSIAAVIFARLRRKPVILIQHVAEIAFASRLKRGLMKLANRMVTRSMLRSADQVIFISDTVRAFFSACPMQRPPLLQFNGVNTGLFHSGEAERAHFGLPDTAPVIAFAGRFVEKKGIAIIHALARLRPDTRFALAGSGPTDPRRWNLPNVHPLGALPPEEVAALFRSADCLVLPSVGEGYPLVIQEAMAVGLPIVCGEESARADPGARSWLHGVRIDLQDVEGSAQRVAEALDRMNADAGERLAMSRYARDHYRWEAFAAGIGTVGQSLVEARYRSGAR